MVFKIHDFIFRVVLVDLFEFVEIPDDLKFVYWLIFYLITFYSIILFS